MEIEDLPRVTICQKCLDCNVEELQAKLDASIDIFASTKELLALRTDKEQLLHEIKQLQAKLVELPCKRCGGINGKHKQVDDPQAGNSNMLTMMQCPFDCQSEEVSDEN